MASEFLLVLRAGRNGRIGNFDGSPADQDMKSALLRAEVCATFRTGEIDGAGMHEWEMIKICTCQRAARKWQLGKIKCGFETLTPDDIVLKCQRRIRRREINVGKDATFVFDSVAGKIASEMESCLSKGGDVKQNERDWLLFDQRTVSFIQVLLQIVQFISGAKLAQSGGLQKDV